MKTYQWSLKGHLSGLLAPIKKIFFFRQALGLSKELRAVGT